MTVTIFDPLTGSLAYASAGHPPALLRRSDGTVVELRAGHGPVLGPVCDATYTEDVLPIAPGDVLVMYTDGLIERRGRDLDTGIAHISEVISTWHGHTSVHLECRRLIESFAPAPRDDDVCVLAVRFVPKA